MVGKLRILQASLVMLCSAAVLTGCGTAVGASGAERTAREMMTADIPLVEPAAPETTQDPIPGAPAPRYTAATEGKPSPADLQTIPADQLMKVAPFDKPKFFHEFSVDGAATVVKYFTYSMYYSFVASDTHFANQVYTNACTKCQEMAQWSNAFTKKYSHVETGVPRTEILDVSVGKTKQNQSVFWVVARNEEPPIIARSENGEVLKYDAPSNTVSQYRVEYVHGSNLITGIYKAPAQYSSSPAEK